MLQQKFFNHAYLMLALVFALLMGNVMTAFAHNNQQQFMASKFVTAINGKAYKVTKLAVTIGGRPTPVENLQRLLGDKTAKATAIRVVTDKGELNSTLISASLSSKELSINGLPTPGQGGYERVKITIEFEIWGVKVTVIIEIP